MGVDVTIFGRRTIRPGDRVAIDTPYLNGIANIESGPDVERGTKTFPKYLFSFVEGILVDPETSFVHKLSPEDEIWLEDDANYISIFGVDDENISLL